MEESDWNQNTSVFNERIEGKSNLIFLIEDEEKNKFGGFVDIQIAPFNWLKTNEMFLFSLQSNGRLKEMMKFDKNPNNGGGFWLDRKNDPYLFGFGSGSGSNQDIDITKSNTKNISICCQTNCYEYNGIQNALRGTNSQFSPKRILVIQMN